MAYIGLFVLIALLPDLYIWQSFVKNSGLVWRVLFWLPFALLVLLPLCGIAGRGLQTAFYVLVILTLCWVVPTWLFALCSLAGRGLAHFAPSAAAWGNGAGFALSGAVVLSSAVGLTAGWRHVVEKRTDIVAPGLPEAFDGYTIVHLSDFHIGTYAAAPAMVDSIVEKVNALHADAVVFTGDLVNADPDEITRFMPALSRIKARDGVFSIMGNHDYCLHRRYTPPDTPARAVAELVRKERAMGWQLLLNEHSVVRRGADSIAIVGVENDGEPPFPMKGDLPRAMRGLPPHIFKVLLSHDPTHWRRRVLPETDIALTLSGHTHAMQLRLGSLSPSALKYSEWGGLYKEGGRQLYVSTGVGSNVAFRLGAWPEIDILTLKRK